MTTRARRWWTLFAMSGALTMVLLDGTGVSVALPSIQRGLELNQSSLQWIITIYSLSLAAMLAIGGRLGDLFGHLRMFVTGVILFAVGSLACAMAPDLAVMLVGRVVEGIGNVLMVPAAAVLVTEAFDPKERGKAMGLYTLIGASFQAFGPLLGGLLIEYASWRAVFLVNVPVAAIVLTLAFIARPVAAPVSASPLKIPQAVVLVAGMALLVLGLQQSHHWGWTSPSTLGSISGGVTLLAMFVASQIQTARRSEEPLLDVRLFGDRAFTADAIVLFCAQFALIGQVAFNALYLQNILRFPPLQAGLALLLFLLPWMAMAPVAGRLYDRFGIKVPAVIGLSLITLGFFLETQTFPHRNFWLVAPCMLLIGLGLGLALTQSYTDGMSRVTPELKGQAYGMLDTVRQMGAAMGIALIGSLVAAREIFRLGPIAGHFANTTEEQAVVEKLLLEAARGQSDAIQNLIDHYPGAIDELRASGARSIADGYYLGTAVTGLGLLLVLVLMRRKPQGVPTPRDSQEANS